jgi:hypothetical protein
MPVHRQKLEILEPQTGSAAIFRSAAPDPPARAAASAAGLSPVRERNGLRDSV